MTIFPTASYLSLRHRLPNSRGWRRLATLVFSLVALGTLSLADGRIARVARISLIEGEVSHQRASAPGKDWYDATLNLPLDESDQLYSGPDGRAEIQLSGRNLVRIDRNTNLRFTQFNTGTIQFALPVGTATFRVDSLDRRQFDIVDARDTAANDPVYFEVDTPVVAITFLQAGNYRVNVRDDGTTEFIVRRGQAEVYNQEIGTITVKQGRRIVIDGRDANYFQIARLEEKDHWDRWNDRRDDELFARADSRSVRYVPAALPGVYDLDAHGDWIETPEYGWVWSPRQVAADWAPYRAGDWRWHPGYGWTWIAQEPWGWVPYHYGRWAYHRSRWCWVPRVIVDVAFGWRWRPHLVVFFGWGGGRYNRGYRDGYWDGYRDGRGYLGWCPLGPRDRYDSYGSTTIVNNTTIINNNTRFLSSLDNYKAPGGVSALESRHFNKGRVLVAQKDLKPLPPASSPGATSKEADTPLIARIAEIKPIESAPTRQLKIERAELAKRIEAPVVERHPAPLKLDKPARATEGDAARNPQPARENQPLPSAPERNAPPVSNVEVLKNAAPKRVADGPVLRAERPERAPEYRPVERTPAPDWSVLREKRKPTPDAAPPSPDATRDYAQPPRADDHPVRRQTPERIEPPARDKAPKRQPEWPRYEPRESAPPREHRESPRREAPPSISERKAEKPPRENAPAKSERSGERPAPPKPAKP